MRCWCGRFRFRGAEPPHGVCANTPEDDRVGSLGLLGLAVLSRVLRADELSVNKDMIALVQRRRDGLAEAFEGISYVESDRLRLSFAIRTGERPWARPA